MIESVKGVDENNPYRPPESVKTTRPQAESDYFATNVLALPVSALWRDSWLRGAPAILISFPILLFRKIFHLPFKPSHAKRRPTDLASQCADEVPLELRKRFAPFEAACRTAGMEPVWHLRRDWIGCQRAFSSIWLNPTGRTYALITSFDMQTGTTQISDMAFACTSHLKSGIQLLTALCSPTTRIPEMDAPDDDMLSIDHGTPPIELIARHQARLASPEDTISFTKESLEGAIVRSGQEYFDFLVAKKIYVPISAEEVTRLKSESPSEPQSSR